MILFCVTFLEGVKFRCDYSHSELGWYKYHEIPATWRDARLKCTREGAILASPTKRVIKYNMIDSMIQYNKSEMFTGFHATFSQGNYYTVDGIPIDKIPHTWAKFEPDNRNNAESCLSLNLEGEFADVRCENTLPFMCFRPESSVDSNVCGTPDPDYRFESETGKCYKFHADAQTFKRAHFVCSAEGGHLAIINSDAESKVLSKIFIANANKIFLNIWRDVAYIGFHTWFEGTDWRTIHGQTLEEAGYAGWSPGEPDNSTTGEYCGSIYPSGKLNDLWCENHYAYICEKEPDYPAVCDNAIERSEPIKLKIDV